MTISKKLSIRKPPRRYRWVKPTEVLIQGDKWWNPDKKRWQETLCYKELMHKEYRPMFQEYIRRGK